MGGTLTRRTGSIRRSPASTRQLFGVGGGTRGGRGSGGFASTLLGPEAIGRRAGRAESAGFVLVGWCGWFGLVVLMDTGRGLV